MTLIYVQDNIYIFIHNCINPHSEFVYIIYRDETKYLYWYRKVLTNNRQDTLKHYNYDKCYYINWYYAIGIFIK